MATTAQADFPPGWLDTPSASAQGSTGAAPSDQTRQSLQAAARLAQDGKIAQADAILQQVLASPDFAALGPTMQHAVLGLCAHIALALRDYPRAHALAKRGSELPGGKVSEWARRMQAASAAQDDADAAFALATIARSWPDQLPKLDARQVSQVVRKAPVAGPARYQLYRALFDAHYTDDGGEPSAWWRDLALLELQRNERAAAIESLRRVTGPYSLVSVRADKRFAGIRAELSGQLDIDAAVAREVEAARARAAARPGKLTLAQQLVDSLLVATRFEEALQVADAAIARAEGTDATDAYTDATDVYDDYDTMYVWMLDVRSRALARLGRYDDAVEQLRAASRLREHGHDNISQVINLADLLNRLGRPREARETIRGIASKGASAYGQMQEAVVRLDSAAQLGDKEEAGRALQFLRSHREDSVKTLQRALLIADQQDEGALLLIGRLADPQERIEALMAVQRYAAVPETARAQELHRRWGELTARPDVQAAIAEAGSADAYQLMPWST